MVHLDKRWIMACQRRARRSERQPHPLFRCATNGTPRVRCARRPACRLNARPRACAARPGDPSAPGRTRGSASSREWSRGAAQAGLRHHPPRRARRGRRAGEHDRLWHAVPRRRAPEGNSRRSREWKIRRSTQAVPDHGDVPVAATAAHVYTECARIWNSDPHRSDYARAAGLPGIILHGTATLALSIQHLLKDFENTTVASALPLRRHGPHAEHALGAGSRKTRDCVRDAQREQRDGHRARLDRLNSAEVPHVAQYQNRRHPGPGFERAGVLERMIRAGVDVVRLALHGTADDHLKRATLVKEISAKVGRTVAIMCDLQGPKIRIGKFRDGKTTLEKASAYARCRCRDGRRPARRPRLQGAAARRRARRAAPARRRQDRARGHRRARRRGAYRGGTAACCPTTRASTARRRPHRAGAHREGHGGHQDRGEAAGRTSSRCLS